MALLNPCMVALSQVGAQNTISSLLLKTEANPYCMIARQIRQDNPGFHYTFSMMEYMIHLSKRVHFDSNGFHLTSLGTEQHHHIS